MLHQVFRIRWNAVRASTPSQRAAVTEEGAGILASPADPAAGASVLVQLLGHKGDLMVIHARPGFDELAATQLALSRSRLSDWLEPATSFVSIVELGMYEMTAKIHQQLADRGLETGSADFDRAFDEEMARQRERVKGRLFVELPPSRYVSFYPMNKRRGEGRNWYLEPFERRAAMMREHGMVGRHYAGRVIQIISGAIGFDDWEWGVDLFADDPLVFKKLIYELRFDEASAAYAEFGPFYVGRQLRPGDLAGILR